MKSDERTCKRCFIRKPIKRFGIDISKKDGRLNVCRECSREKIKIAQEQLRLYWVRAGKKERERAQKSQKKSVLLASPVTNMYILQATGSGLIKIGVSKNIEKRLVALQTGSPFKLIVVRLIDKIPFLLEKELHDQLSGYRLHGEWFKEDVLAFIDNRIDAILQKFEEMKQAR